MRATRRPPASAWPLFLAPLLTVAYYVVTPMAGSTAVLTQAIYSTSSVVAVGSPAPLMRSCRRPRTGCTGA